MADWHGAARTNHFPVKDAGSFKAWAESSGLHASMDEATDLWSLHSEDPSGAWPSRTQGPDGEFRDFDIVAELAAHAAPDWPVVLMQAGFEKARYVRGQAVAFRVRGGEVARITISLDDIYWLAQARWGVAPTRCAS